MHGVGQGCAKNVLEEHDAVPEMKVDPSKSVCRNRASNSRKLLQAERLR